MGSSVKNILSTPFSTWNFEDKSKFVKEGKFSFQLSRQEIWIYKAFFNYTVWIIGMAVPFNKDFSGSCLLFCSGVAYGMNIGFPFSTI
jgi:hypothetical protein